MKNSKFFDRNSFNTRQLIMWSTFFVGLIFATIIMSATSRLMASNPKLSIYVSMVIQDILVFIAPAFITAIIISRKAATFLRLNVTPKWRELAFMLLLFIVSLPAMNYIVSLNEAIRLPESLSGIEQTLRAMENAAQDVTDMLIGDNSTLIQLLPSLILVGALAGFSEEIFFRGTMQSIFVSRPTNIHVSVWFTALLFSVLHFQFYGFIPRLLMGAMFGYMLVWSGSLWIPVIAHTLNNSVVVVGTYLINNNIISANLDNIGIPPEGELPRLAFISFVLTLFLFRYKRFFFKTKTSKPE